MVYTLEVVFVCEKICCRECLESKLQSSSAENKHLGATVLFFFNATTGSWSVVVSFRTTCTLLVAAATT